MTEPQLSAETREDILDLVDPKVPYSHFVRVLEKYTQEVIATALEEQKTKIIKSIVEAGGFITESKDGKTEVEYKVDPVRTTVGFKGITI